MDRREEIIDLILELLHELANLPADSGAAKTPSKAVQRPSEGIRIPEVLDTPAFRVLFLEFQEHRKLKDPKDHWTPFAVRRKLASLAKLGHDEACRWVEFALDNGLKNIQEPFQKGLHGGPDPEARKKNLDRLFEDKINE